MPQTIPGYHLWEVPGKSMSVQMNLDTIDRLSSAVLTGFGAIPRRGAEVGGILVGSIQDSVVRIDEFEPVACSYRRGPSYLLDAADQAAFAEAFEKWKPAPGKDQYAVGYYRSNTRDDSTLSIEDRALCDQFFPPPSNVVLLIKPYATKVSTAGFITYENGRLDAESAFEFPFRRFELEGGTAPARRPLSETRHLQRTENHAPPPRFDTPPAPTLYEAPPPPPQPEPERAYAVTTEPPSRRKSWIWIPMSFIFLLLGVMLGFQAALTMYPRTGTPATSNDDYSINLTATRSEENLHVKWDRESRVIRQARRGVLNIQDGTYSKQVELDPTQLQNGSVIYRKLSGRVRFRFEVYPRDRVAVTESVEWKE